MKSIKLEPYCQGHLDRYCGIYCMINIVHYLKGTLDRRYAKRIFNQSMGMLHKRRSSERFTTEGICLKDLIKLLELTCTEHQLQYRRAFTSNKGISLDRYLSELKWYIANHGAIALIGIDGFYRHWTLVRGVTSRSLHLFDSDGLQRLNLSRCTTQGPSEGHRHYLIPDNTYFIWADQSDLEEVSHG